MVYKSPSSIRLTRIGAACFLLFGFVPILALLLNASPPVDLLQLAIPTGRRLDILMTSLVLAVSTAGLGTMLGALIGSWILQPGKIPVRFKLLFIATFLVPPHIHYLAWTETFQFLTSTFSIPLITGLPATIWVQTMYMLPLSAGMASLAFANLDRRQIETALVLSNPQKTWLKIVLPQAAPTLLAGAGLVMILSLVDYTIPSLFQLNTYSIEIFTEFSATNQAIRPLLLAAPLLVLTCVVLTATYQGMRSALLKPIWKTYGGILPPWPTNWRTVRGVSLCIGLIQLLTPLLTILLTVNASASTLQLADATPEILYSLKISLLAAGLSLLPALAYAKIMVAGGTWRWLAPLVILALPAPLIGAGLINVFHGTAIMDSDLLPILASTCRFLPAAALVLAGSLAQLPQPQLEAGLVHVRKPTWYTRKVLLPLLMPGIVCAGMLVSALSLGELGATLIVTPPGRGTVSMKIYNYLQAGSIDAIAGLCLVTLVLILAGGMLVYYGISMQKR